MAAAMQAAILTQAPWRDPTTVLSALGEQPWTIGFVSGGPDAAWSYVAAEPDAVLSLEADDPRDAFEALRAFAGPTAASIAGGPPFQGGVAGLLSYDLGDRIERLGLDRLDGWPDLACARYPSMLAFDHRQGRVLAMGRGETQATAEQNMRRALGWLDLPSRASVAPAAELTASDPEAYETAVDEVVSRIRSGEIFQANIARRWTGRLSQGAAPVDLLTELATASPAPFAAYLRLADRALVSNSPERFVEVARDATGLLARTQPIKGTAPRGATAEADAALAAELRASPKNRAENLMIVDLMRNDLSRVCDRVETPELFELASFANVHHLVSTVIGRLRPGADAVDLLRATFPPGSITGAPKVQAMKVISRLEAPRGPFFGSMFHLGSDGALDSNVLIRTVAFARDAQGWRAEARAGAGIVADSDPALERRETETKISLLAAALTRN